MLYDEGHDAPATTLQMSCTNVVELMFVVLLKLRRRMRRPPMGGASYSARRIAVMLAADPRKAICRNCGAAGLPLPFCDTVIEAPGLRRRAETQQTDRWTKSHQNLRCSLHPEGLKQRARAAPMVTCTKTRFLLATPPHSRDGVRVAGGDVDRGHVGVCRRGGDDVADCRRERAAVQLKEPVAGGEARGDGMVQRRPMGIPCSHRRLTPPFASRQWTRDRLLHAATMQ